HDFLVAAVLALALSQHLQLPTHPLRVSRVHAEEVAREDSRFISTGAGTDLQEDVALVVGVTWNQRLLQRQLQFLAPFVQRLQFLAAHLANLAIGVGGHLFCRGDFALQPFELVEQAHHRLKTRVFAGQVAELVLVADDARVGKQAREFLEPVPCGLELVPDRFFHFDVTSLRRSPLASGWSPVSSRPNSSRIASMNLVSEAAPASRRRTLGWCNSFLSNDAVTYSSTSWVSAPLSSRRRACSRTSRRNVSPWSRRAVMTGATSLLRSMSR